MSNRRVSSLPFSDLKQSVRRLVLPAAIAGLLAMVPSASARPQEMQVTTQLSSALTATLHKGDPISAQVTSPDALKGDSLRGKVTNVNSSRGQSTVEFAFDTLVHSGLAVAVAANIQGVSNSKGQPAVDDQGHSVLASNVAAKQPRQSRFGSRLGGQVGGIVGGRTGEVASDASSETDNVSVGGAPPSIQIVGQGGLALGPGSTIKLSLQSNGGESLASLVPNPPTAPASPSPLTVSAPGSSAPVAGAQSAAANAAAGGGQPELKSTKIEFVPGERTIFLDDFSDMVPDEPPPHWKVRDGKIQLRTGGGVRELYSDDKDGVNLTSGKFVVPKDFTFELEWTGGGEMTWHFQDKDGNNLLEAMVRGEEDGMTASTVITGPDGSELGHGEIAADTNKPVEFAFWAQQGRVRAYINGERLVDANQVEFGQIDHLNVQDAGYRPNGIRVVRVAESVPDFSAVINASGKYVTHGINFDTDSDRLKPESSAVLKQVAAGLGRNPNLKLEIDGYTDSVGDAAHNLDLSKRRAQAVQTVLVSQFGVDASRLTSSGFGAGKPVGSNDTPEGRAENRRVEFLKK